MIKLSILLSVPRTFAPNTYKRRMSLVRGTTESKMQHEVVCVFSIAYIWGNLAFYTANALLDIFACTSREKI